MADVRTEMTQLLASAARLWVLVTRAIRDDPFGVVAQQRLGTSRARLST